jgi:hypothetical protein
MSNEAHTIPQNAAAIVIDEAGDVRVIMPEGVTSEPPWPSSVFVAAGIAAMLQPDSQDEMTALFVRKLHKSVREIAAKTAPETLRRHDMMKSLDPETAARN